MILRKTKSFPIYILKIVTEVKKKELTAICLVYYGTSISHLLNLLHSEGHVNVCENDILRQNKQSGRCDHKIKLKSFRKLCKLSLSKETTFVKTKEKG